jgi:MOSC domain-containing protein YiiM
MDGGVPRFKATQRPRPAPHDFPLAETRLRFFVAGAVSFAIRHIFISDGHNFFGRYGQVAGEHLMREVPRVRCRAGWGLEGDRFYGYRPGYRGQVTFLSWETLLAARKKFRKPKLSPGAFRRNVITEGIDLNTLIGRRFTLDGVEFEGTEESRPCHWMNGAVAPGAEDWMQGRGGLRARVLSDGEIAVGPFELRLFQEVA